MKLYLSCFEVTYLLLRITMLILTRNLGEAIFIDDNIQLTVLNIDGSKVRVGIEAPKAIPVFREEIYYRIQKEKAMALSDSANRKTGYSRV